MNFSKLRHRITFLKPVENAENEMGEAIPKYVPFKPYLDENSNHTTNYSVAAYVAPMSGREYEESQKLRVETTYKISTRYFPQINPTHRILYNGKEFEIVSVLDLNGRHEELQIIATEKDLKTDQSYEDEIEDDTEEYTDENTEEYIEGDTDD